MRFRRFNVIHRLHRLHRLKSKRRKASARQFGSEFVFISCIFVDPLAVTIKTIHEMTRRYTNTIWLLPSALIGAICVICGSGSDEYGLNSF